MKRGGKKTVTMAGSLARAKRTRSTPLPAWKTTLSTPGTAPLPLQCGFGVGSGVGWNSNRVLLLTPPIQRHVTSL